MASKKEPTVRKLSPNRVLIRDEYGRIYHSLEEYYAANEDDTDDRLDIDIDMDRIESRIDRNFSRLFG